ncbi:hypothetical protein Tco_0275369 [Tanacetum coccineum]
MFDLDFLTNSMKYIPVSVENQVNVDAAKDVVPDAQEQPSENASTDKGIQILEDVFDKEGQHQMPDVTPSFQCHVSGRVKWCYVIAQ